MRLIEPPECLKRAEECLRLAETEDDPNLKKYLYRLAAVWRKAAEGDFEELFDC